MVKSIGIIGLVMFSQSFGIGMVNFFGHFIFGRVVYSKLKYVNFLSFLINCKLVEHRYRGEVHSSLSMSLQYEMMQMPIQFNRRI